MSSQKRKRRNKIFISYRREDSSAATGRLADLLKRKFGSRRVFMDIDSIDPGIDFVKSIEEAVESCLVFLPVIGSRWLTAADDKGRRRLDDDHDLVRAEIAVALKHSPEITVIPVLIEGASMPRAEDLPDDIQLLARQNAVVLSNHGWRRDAQALVEHVEHLMPGWRFRRRALKVVGTAAAVILVVVAAGFAINRLMNPPQLELRTPPSVDWEYDLAQNNLKLSFQVYGENKSSQDADILNVNAKLETATQPSVILASDLTLTDLNCHFDNGNAAPRKLYFKANESIRLECSPLIKLSDQGAAAMKTSTLRISVEFVDKNNSTQPMIFCLNTQGETKGHRIDPQCMREEL